MKSQAKICFFGGEPLGVPALTELKVAGIMPDLIVSSPDRPSGRGLKLTPPPVKIWAQENEIEVFQPESYKDREKLSRITNEEWDLFVVVAYNFILPEWFLEMPRKGVINVHPSLLPKLRGASPIRTAILKDRRADIGVTIMLMDKKMDHGPILEQAAISIANEDWPLSGPDLDSTLAQAGGSLLAKAIPEWLDSTIEPQEQDHEAATYTKRFTKGENELTLDPSNLPTGQEAFQTLSKIRAWTGIGDTYFMHDSTRVKVKTARLLPNGQLQLERVIPEGKKEMDFTTFLQSLSSQ